MANEQIELESGPNGENANTPQVPALTLDAPTLPTLNAPTLHAGPSACPTHPLTPRRPTTARRGRGKVARLPLLIRNVANQAIRDGVPYAEIGPLLAARGFPGFKAKHISSWVQHGYKQWLAEQERFEQSSRRSDRAAALLGGLRDDGRSETADLNESILAAQHQDLLDSIDESQLRQLLAENPGDYFRLNHCVTSLALARAKRLDLELKRLKYELELRKIEEREKRRLKPQEITPEMRARIEAAAKLL